MSTATLVTAGGAEWRVETEPGPHLAARYQVVMRAELVDELTGDPPRQAAKLTSLRRGLDPRSAAIGLVGLAGRPSALFPDPWPAPAPRVAMRVELDGFLPLPLEDVLPAQPGYPDAFAPLDLGVIALHRQPTLITGHVVDAGQLPVPGAVVAVTAIWPMNADILGPGLAPNGLSLGLPLYTDRAPGAAVRRDPLAVLPDPKVLVEPASAGATRLRLSDGVALQMASVLAIETGDPARMEVIGADPIAPGADPDQRAWITLHHPLAQAHPAGAAVERRGTAPAGPPSLLTAPARGGDRTLLVDGVAGLNQPMIEISGGAAPEYHAVGLWQAVTGADGRYRLPPIHRVAHLELTATAAGQTPVTRIVSLAGEPERIADLVFP